MKRLLLATTSLLSLATSAALAGDLAPIIAKTPAIEPFDWAGVHVGVHGGYLFSKQRLADMGVVGERVEVKPDSALFGIQVGYDTRLNRNTVVGYELDLSAAGAADSGLTSTRTTETKIDYLGTARARLGYAVDHLLLYVTAGMAWAQNKFRYFDGTATYYTRDQFHLGWTAGAGVEYAFNGNWSAKAEYLYADLGHNPQTVANTLHRDVDLTLHMARVGLNYRFDNSAPRASAPAYAVKAHPERAAHWSGFYIGGHGGYVWSDAEVLDAIPSPGQASDMRANSGFAGFTTGYNWLFTPNWLVGLESETSFSWAHAQSQSVPGGYPTSTRVNYSGSERIRLGYTRGDWLVYGTGGLAWARINYELDTTEPFSTSKYYAVGWVAGAGVEILFAPEWSAKLEYLHADYGTNKTLVLLVAPPQTISTIADSVKVGVNYHGDILGALFR